MLPQLATHPCYVRLRAAGRDQYGVGDIGPLVTVVIPTYGRPRWLAEAIASVAGQTYRPIELVIVDDCSPDAVEPVVPDDLSHRLVRHARNQGPGAARNTGLAHAGGELILFLDDDDVLLPDRIERGVEAIGSCPMHAMARSDRDQRFEGDLRATLLEGMPPHVSQVLLRRSAVLQFDPCLRVSEDVEWWTRMRHQAVFAWSEGVGVRIRSHDTTRAGVDPTVRAECRRIILCRHLATSSRRERAFHLTRAAGAELLAGRRLRGCVYAIRSLLNAPSTLAVKILANAVTGRIA